MQIRNNSFFSPFFIFIKDHGQLTDEALFQLFGLHKYDLVTEEEEREMEKPDKRYLFVAEDQDWKHLMDDFCYTLWQQDAIHDQIKALSKTYDIYCCSIGDTDDSFDFQYYKAGELIRDYVVEDLNYSGGVVLKNEGAPIAGEAQVLAHEDRFEKVLGVARLIGINTFLPLEEVRCYATKDFPKRS